MDDKPAEVCPCCGGTGIRQPKGKGGPKRRTVDPDDLRRLAEMGLPNSRIASFFGWPERSFYWRVKRDPAMRAAIEEGRREGAIKWGALLREKAAEGNGAAIAKMMEILREGGY